MAGEDRKAIVRRVYEEMFNHGQLDGAGEVFSENFVTHEPNPLPNQPLHGPESVRWYISFVRSAFPDLHATVEDMLEDGDEIAIRFTITGTQTGQFVYLAPTDRKVHVIGIDLVRFEGNQIVEHWGGWNRAELLVQLGIFPHAEGTQY
jgi:predicted ester cyclase